MENINLIGHMALFCKNIDNNNLTKEDKLLISMNIFGLCLNSVGYEVAIHPTEGNLILIDNDTKEVVTNISEILSRKLEKDTPITIKNNKVIKETVQ